LQIEVLEDRCVPSTFTVMNTADSGTGSLRQAILDSNAATPGPNFINFDPTVFSTPQTITLATGEMLITTSVTIAGPGSTLLTVDANMTSRIFDVNDFLPGASDVTITGMTLTHGNGNNGSSGGAIFNLDENLTLIDTTITGNTTTGFNKGGGLANYAGTVLIQNSTITGNIATDGGGGLYFDGGSLTVQNTSITNNKVTYLFRDGGALYSEHTTVLIQNSTITGNTCTAGGGGIYDERSSLTIENSTLAMNTASYGGGISMDDGGALTVQGSTISGNTANGTNQFFNAGGGGLFLYNVTTTITTAIITGNTAVAHTGGGITFENGKAIIQNSLISGNTAHDNGGGLYFRGDNFPISGSLTVMNSTVSGNTTTNGSGGGIALYATTASVINSTIYGNTATLGNGGGVVAVEFGYDGGPRGTPEFFPTSLTRLNMFNSTLSGNAAPAGKGGGMYLAVITSSTLDSTIIAGGNSALTSPDLNAAINFAGFNLIGDGTGSSGVVNGTNGNQVGSPANPIDPMLGKLQNNGGPAIGVSSATTPLTTLALLAGSPAIDKGDNSFLSLTTDERGFNRVVNNVIDVGAYEYQPPPTLTVVTSAANPSFVGEAVTFTATVSGLAPGSNTPIGTVTFMDGSTILASNVTLINGAATFTTSTLTAGTHPITASYSGFTIGDYVLDPNTSSPALEQFVSLFPTSTTIATSLTPAALGQSVTFTATVTTLVPTALTPGASVTFFDGATTLGMGTLGSGGTTTFSTSTLSAGSHIITATYGGDVNFFPSNSPALKQVITPQATTTTLTTSLNPSTIGQLITLTATVLPTGTSSFTPGGTVIFFDGSTPLGIVSVGSGGVTTLNISTLSAGSHSLTAAYSGDNNFLTSSSPPLIQVVNLIATTTTLTTSLSPAPLGQAITLTATVTGAVSSSLTLTGTVSFFEGSTLLGVGIVSGGSATFTTSSLRPGTHTLTAVYSGDLNFIGSTSPPLIQVIFVAPILVTGEGAGFLPQVNVYNSDGSERFNFLAYSPFFLGGVRVAVGDVLGTGIPQIITSAGPGGGPHIRIFDAQTGAVLREFMGGDPTILTGYFVAVADLNGDGFADIIMSADVGGGPLVKVFSGKDDGLMNSFSAYDPSFTGGVRVAVGDVFGTGKPDIITAPGPGMVSTIKVFSGIGSLEESFQALPSTFTGGAFVGVGDVNGDGHGDVIVGPGSGMDPLVQAFDGTTLASTTPKVLDSFFAYTNFQLFMGGVVVASGEFDSDGVAEIITGAGPGGGPHVRTIDGATGNPLTTPLGGFMAYLVDFHGGVFVGAG
jgi:hypothetical protein